MEKFQMFIEQKISPIAGKIAASKFITCLMAGFTTIMPLIIIGSICSLITGFEFFGISSFLEDCGIKPYLALVNTFTNGAISLFLIISIAHNVAKVDMDESEARIVAFISLVAFLIMTPLLQSEQGTGINMQLLGAKGMFVSMILGFVVPSIYTMFTKHHLVIHMPDSVPPFIAKSFRAIIPASVIFIFAVIGAYGLGFTAYGSIHNLIYTLIQKPFEALTGNIFGYILITFMIQLFWFFGIHGGMTFDALKNALFTQAALMNIAAFGSGEQMEHVVTIGLSDLAGAGVAQGLGLLICLYFFCKREDFKALSKIGVVPQIFGITEPVRFGVPTVFNFTLMVPLLFFQPMIEFLAYLCCQIGILSFPRVGSIKNVPIFLSGFMQGGMSGVIFQIFALILAVLCFLPFVKAYEKQKNKEDEKLLESQK